MSTTNGQAKSPKSLRELREQRRVLEVKLEMRRLRMAHKMLKESWSADDSLLDFGGSDLFFRQRADTDFLAVPPSQPSDRKHGQKWPLWRTEPELDRIRQQGRLLHGHNSFAQGLLRNLTNYVIGKGFAYNCVIKDAKKGREITDDLRHLQEATQHFVDHFLASNRWNAVVNHENALICAGTREREIYQRVIVDGEAFLRCWHEADGSTMIRSVEPEQVRNPPGYIEAQGWSMGIRHQMDPFEDMETPEEYYIRFADPSSALLHHENADPSKFGEMVPSSAILHLKGPDTLASSSRGTSYFSGDVARSLQRASKLQQAISVGSTWRAATAEIIQHKGHTATQVSAFIGGQADGQYLDPQSGKLHSFDRAIPGTRRHIPEGMEFVALPADQSAAGHQEAVRGDLRQAGSSFSAPEFWFGDASNSNYSSLETASAPPVKNAETEQEYYKAAFSSMLWKAIRWAVEKGRLHPAVLKEIEIQVEAPAVLHRNELEDAQKNQILNQLGVKSPQTIGMEAGLDPEIELANIEEFKERTGGGEGGLPGMPEGMPGQEEMPPEEGEGEAPSEEGGELEAPPEVPGMTEETGIFDRLGTPEFFAGLEQTIRAGLANRADAGRQVLVESLQQTLEAKIELLHAEIVANRQPAETHIHNEMPKQEPPAVTVPVNVAPTTVNVPQPIVNLAQPDIKVTAQLPEQKLPAPEIKVIVPRQPAPKITNKVDVKVETPKVKKVVKRPRRDPTNLIDEVVEEHHYDDGKTEIT